MVRLEIETLGDERFVRGFNRYVEQMKDFREVYQGIWEDFTEVTERNFAREGFPRPFRPLSPKYKEWKDRNFPGRPILQLRYRLIRSLLGRAQAEAQDTVKDIGAREAEFGTQVPYANRHQRSGRMPVQLTDGDKVRWSKMIHEWSYRKLRGEIE